MAQDTGAGVGSIEEQNYNEFLEELEQTEPLDVAEDRSQQEEEPQHHEPEQRPEAGVPRAFGPLGEMKEVRARDEFETRRERRHREEKSHVERRRQLLAITDVQRPEEQNRQHLHERQAAEVLEKRRRLLDDVPHSFRRPAYVPVERAPPSEPPPSPTRTAADLRPELRRLLNDVPHGIRRPAPYETGPRAFVVGPTVLLVGNAKGKELLWSEMTVAQRKQFLLAMNKEWAKWTQFRATIPCPKKVLDKYPDELKIIGTRWVMTYKSDGTPKARMVVQGCQENLRDVRGDAPTGSRDSMMLAIAFGSSSGWGLSQWDADSAYLQSEGLDRALLLRLPNPAPPGHQPGDIVVATGAIYGTKDAGRKWYLHLKKMLDSFGIVECALEKGLYRMYWQGSVRMVIHTHVDDLLVAMEMSCAHAKHTLEKLQKSLYLKGGTGQVFEYLARTITITADTITVSQAKSAANVEAVPIEKERRIEPDSLLTPPEKTEFRSLIGSLSWLAQQTRLDIAVAVNKSAQRIEKATIQDLMQANSIAKQSLRHRKGAW